MDFRIAEALGLPLFTTDLFLPAYREGRVGRWQIRIRKLGLEPGYWSGLWAVRDTPVLLREAGDPPRWQPWMSLSPHEVESQELGCRHAVGHTAVMGLGMGWIAANAALNPDVAGVTVVERDPEVIDLFHQTGTGALEALPKAAAAKIAIVEADALEWKPDRPVDFLYADIWQKLAEPRTLGDVRRMQANVGAKTVYYWGQELTIYTEAKRRFGEDEPLTGQRVCEVIDEAIALPLLVPPGKEEEYSARIERAAHNRRARGLSMG